MRRWCIRAAFVALLVAACWSAVAAEGAGFTFVEAADTHVLDEASTVYLDRVVDLVNADETVALSLWAGDLTTASKPDEMKLAKACLDRLERPHYAVRGNHDQAPGVFEAIIGPLRQTFDHAGWRFLLCDSNPGDATPMSPTDRDWLAEQLRRTDPKMPLVLCCHHPLGPHAKTRLAGADDVLALFKGYNLKAVLNAHFHGNQEETLNGVLFTTTACCTTTRTNHDGTKPKGYRRFHCTAEGAVKTEFVAVPE